MKLSSLTSADNYFEDFRVGDVLKHARGKTITPLDNVLITNLVLNSAEGHFNDHKMAATPFGSILSYGGVNFSLVLGLSTQDCCENALEEIGLDKVKLTRPVTHGDTLYAYSEVLSVENADRDDAGIIRFKHWGVNQRDEVCVEIERIAVIKRRSHWGWR
ncbi:MaoC family dehydratase [Sphingobium sp. 3R8]|uniref:MaoC family dehydratase n=1 Tax=Sphingobium sp. 3R8 TaxID=2874921 RepID=UPI001CD01A3C|nr:MaoC family dehydratase [Sphingobium sp. 3R8]MBZ9646892.1 MaoC family dehydratase [Sphingobium sp. 3R8]